MTMKTNTAIHWAVGALLEACTWLVGLRRAVKLRTLSDAECESGGLPLGSVEQCAYAFPLAGLQRWRVDAWDDGECLHIQALGWSLEVHHEAREGAPVGA